MNPHSAIAALIVAGLGLSLSGCTQFEPFQRQGTWHENQAPMQNIAIELANPRDLYRGTGHPVLTGNIASTAIDSVTSTLSGGSSSTGAGSGTAGSTGGSTAGGSVGASGSTASSGGMGGASTGGTGGTTGGAMP